MKMKEYRDADGLIELALQVKIKKEILLEEFKRARDATLPNLENLSTIIDRDQFALLWLWLPSRVKLQMPHRIFRSSINGFNLHTLINKCGSIEPTVLLIKSDSGKIFGAFVSTTWERGIQYRGTGEMFLFNLFPSMKKYPWTTMNRFFILIKDNTLMVGGGTGCGLWLDDELLRGMSGMCETFDNEPLNGEKDFQCVEIEVFFLQTTNNITKIIGSNRLFKKSM